MTATEELVLVPRSSVDFFVIGASSLSISLPLPHPVYCLFLFFIVAAGVVSLFCSSYFFSFFF